MRYILKNIIFLFLLFVCVSLHGQELQLKGYLNEDLDQKIALKAQERGISSKYDKPFQDSSRGTMGISSAFLPEYARNNPSGYTYLCRLEVTTEKKLPVGVWVDIGDESIPSNPSTANANLRFRFKLK